MSDRTKFFAEKEQQENAEAQRRLREGEEKKEAALVCDATCVEAALRMQRLRKILRPTITGVAKLDLVIVAARARPCAP